MHDGLPASLEASENFLAVPIFIQNLNRVSYLSRLVQWLMAGGYRNIIIIDNGSTYPPVLDYYADFAAKNGIEVVKLPAEATKTGLWQYRVLERFGVVGPFVYTDSDVIPDARCPPDVVAHLAAILRDNPSVFKAGLGLRIDDLPDGYQFRREVTVWERQFWRAPVARGVFRAPVDTTFALYRPRSEYSLDAVRTGWPYLARHEPWYIDSANPTEETLTYLATALRGNWVRTELPAWLRDAVAELASKPQPVLLHLGCGHEIIPGWINLDVSDQVGADVVFDLESCAERQIPVANDSVDGFFMSHVFEHITNTLPMMQELYRVAKPDGRFVIRLPHGASNEAFEDPTHKRPYFPNSFVYFAQPAYSRADYNYRGDWRVERVKLVVHPGEESSEGEVRLLERIMRERNIVREMIVELRAVKPARPRELRLLEWPAPTISRTVMDEESAF